MSSVFLSFNNKKLEDNHSFISLIQAYKVAYADDEGIRRVVVLGLVLIAGTTIEQVPRLDAVVSSIALMGVDFMDPVISRNTWFCNLY